MIFYCPKHKTKTQEHSQYSSVVGKSGEMEHRDKDKNPIVCPNKKCGLPMTYDKDDDVDYSTVAIGKFSSMSPEQKREVLKKRSKEHNKKFKDYRRHLDTNHL